MVKKRAGGEGTITKRADGRWMARISLGFDDRTGKRLRKSVYGATQSEVRSKLDALKRKPAHSIVNETAVTVKDYLTAWLTNEIQPSKAGKTIREYTDTVDSYISPYLGNVKLAKLSPAKVQQWMGDMSRDDFSANMRAKGLRILRNALNSAMRLELISQNPTAAIKFPKVVRRDIHPLEPEQCRDLFSACQADRIGDIIVLAAMTGLRKGELFALEWSDVNLSERVITIRRTLEEVSGKLKIKETKSKAGRRAVVLDEVGANALKSRLAKAIAEGFEIEQVPIVFPNTLGTHQRGSNFDRRTWHPIRKAAGIPDTIKFHDLRHTQASLLLAAGVHPKVVQERLGHSDISLTLNTYSHLLSGLQAEAVDKLSAFNLTPSGCEK